MKRSEGVENASLMIDCACVRHGFEQGEQGVLQKKTQAVATPSRLGLVYTGQYNSQSQPRAVAPVHPRSIQILLCYLSRAIVFELSNAKRGRRTASGEDSMAEYVQPRGCSRWRRSRFFALQKSSKKDKRQKSAYGARSLVGIMNFKGRPAVFCPVGSFSTTRLCTAS
jgi:hypothetical protein